MMTDHKDLADKLNRRAATAHENAILDAMEKKTTPLFYAVMLAAAVVITLLVWL